MAVELRPDESSVPALEHEEGEPDLRSRIEDADVWRERLIVQTKRIGDRVVRVVAPNAANVATILRYHPRWRGIVATDAFAEAVVTLKPAPWHPVDAPENHRAGEWSDADTSRAVNWMAREESLATSTKVVEQALSVVAESLIVHPVREYLRRRAWDGKERLPTLLSGYFGAHDSEYTRGVGARWMIAAVARVMQPGAQADCALILEGPQGVGKTSAFRALVPVASWYADTGIDLANKDSLQALRSVWIYGLDELDSLRRSELTRTKNFITATSDHYRPSYAHRTRTFPRQYVFAGTTNEAEYLNDRSGNRRFWPVRVTRPINVLTIQRDRDQLWAEAYARFSRGERWHVDTPEFRALCEREQAERMQADPWESVISRWLERPTFVGQDGNPEIYNTKHGVLTVDVLVNAVGKRTGDLTKADEMRAADILRSLGYARGPLRSERGTRLRRYVLPEAQQTIGGADVVQEGGA